ncbi:hypothetical protein [Micromonospora sp. CA-246542]|uniref:hypothetical protein n=1 Tax=Micromonospora sp. CA-246542 TaxID=3239959 RepID=UPI003D8CAFE8
MSIVTAFVQAREDDGFRQTLRSMATKRKVDFSFNASLSWPVEEWYDPETGTEEARQKVVRDRRKQGLSDRLSGPGVVQMIAARFRK